MLDQCSPPWVLHCCFQFPGPRKLRGCWLQQQTADQAISDSLSPPSNPLRPKMTNSPDLRLRPRRAEDDGSSCPQANPWSRPGAAGYLPTGVLPTGYLPTGYLPIGAVLDDRLRTREVGSNRRSHKRQGRQSPRSPISTSKSPAVIKRIRNNPMLVTGTINECPQQPPARSIF